MTLPSDTTFSVSPQTLFIDADDTLWENNIYFERAIASFISYLDHRLHNPSEVREHLNTVERATVASRGYGVESFRISLATCLEQLADAPLDAEKRASIDRFVSSIADQDIEVLPGVLETLTALSMRHRILLVTKGDAAEQKDKLSRSGLAPFFSNVEVLPEKHEEAYRHLAAKHGCQSSTTWMIGNSPRSDINPALAAGLNAVFIPHHSTWVLEREEVHPPPSGQMLMKLSTFAALGDLF